MPISPSSLRPNIGLRSITTFLFFAAACILALLGFVRVLPALLQIPTQPDFAAYYVAARMLNADMVLYRPSQRDDVALGIAGIQHTRYIYPPFFAAMVRPLALLPYRLAESIWFIGNVLLFVPLGMLLRSLIGIAKRWDLAIILVGMLLPAVYDTWLLGQVSILLSILILGSLALAIHKEMPYQPFRDVVAGMLLGFAVAIKIYPIVLSAIYFRHRRWSVLLGMASSMGIAGLIGLVFGGGWEATHYWFTTILPNASAMDPFPSNQSFRGVVARFWTINTFQVPVLNKDNYIQLTIVPILNNPTFSATITLLASAIVLIITAWMLLQRSSFVQHPLLTLDVAIGTTVMLMITPVVWDLYYVHLLLPLGLLASVARAHTSMRLALAGVCMLLALQRYWRYFLLYVQSPWLMLSGLLAVLLLWVVLLIVRTQPNDAVQHIEDT